MLIAMVHRRLPQQDPESTEPDTLHPVLHWLRRLFKLVAAVVLFPPVLLAVLAYFSAWKAVAKSRAWRDGNARGTGVV